MHPLALSLTWTGRRDKSLWVCEVSAEMVNKPGR